MHKKWDDKEEQQLLSEIKNNYNIDLIAKIHNRTISYFYWFPRKYCYNTYSL